MAVGSQAINGRRLKVFTLRDGDYFHLGDTGMPNISGKHTIIATQSVTLVARAGRSSQGEQGLRLVVLINEKAPDKPRAVSRSVVITDELRAAVVKGVAKIGEDVPDSVITDIAGLLAPYLTDAPA